jgi:hypothetical protein
MRRVLIAIIVSTGAMSLDPGNAHAQPSATARQPASLNGFVSETARVTFTGSRPARVNHGGFVYARLGYGGILGDGIYGTRATGFGYRGELDAFAIDGSVFNIQSGGDGIAGPVGAQAFSWVKLQALYFLEHDANASLYVGGGLSWGSRSLPRADDADPDMYTSDWDGSGYQGELTVGYELLRDSPIRIFVEGNVALPLYTVTSERFSGRRYERPVDVSRRYAPSFVASVGFGWQRD